MKYILRFLLSFIAELCRLALSLLICICISIWAPIWHFEINPIVDGDDRITDFWKDVDWLWYFNGRGDGSLYNQFYDSTDNKPHFR